MTAYTHTMAEAIRVAVIRARRTSIRHRVKMCRLDGCPRHFVVAPVDAPPAMPSVRDELGDLVAGARL